MKVLPAESLHFTFPNFIRYRRMMNGGGEGSQNGPTSQKRSRFTRVMSSRAYLRTLGFYDLRVPETRAEQARMARSAGIEGFCYWHYWFGHGRRILERPFHEVLTGGEPSFPFCLAWANQSWTGIWYGNPKSVLIEQKYPAPRTRKRILSGR